MRHLTKIVVYVALFLVCVILSVLLKRHLDRWPDMALVLLGLLAGFAGGLLHARIQSRALSWGVQYVLFQIPAWGITRLVDQQPYILAGCLFAASMLLFWAGQRLGRSMESPSESPSR